MMYIYIYYMYYVSTMYASHVVIEVVFFQLQASQKKFDPLQES